MIQGGQVITQMHNLAASLTADPEQQHEWVRRMAAHLLQQRAVGQLPHSAAAPVAEDLTELVMPHLTARQQQVWSRLLQKQSNRDIGRQLGISHVAVIKQRRRIAEILRKIFLTPAPTGVPSTRNSCAALVAIIFFAITFISADATARPRPMTDAEMDEVCAKGTVGMEVDGASVRELVFTFAHQSTAAAVAGSIHMKIEQTAGSPDQVQVSVGSQLITPGAPVVLDKLNTINIQAVDAQLRVTGDVNLSITPSAQLQRALERQQILINTLTTGGLTHALGRGRGR